MSQVEFSGSQVEFLGDKIFTTSILLIISELLSKKPYTYSQMYKFYFTAPGFPILQYLEMSEFNLYMMFLWSIYIYIYIYMYIYIYGFCLLRLSLIIFKTLCKIIELLFNLFRILLIYVLERKKCLDFMDCERVRCWSMSSIIVHDILLSIASKFLKHKSK